MSKQLKESIMSNNEFYENGPKSTLKELERLYPKSYWEEKYPHLTYVGMTMRPVQDFFDDNLGIRHQGTPDAEPLSVSLDRRGWDVNHAPPMYTITTKAPLDGRTRASECSKLGVKEIPCADFVEKKSDTPLSDRIGVGIISNNHDYAGTLGWKDFVAAGVHVVSAGEVDLSREDIEDFFVRKCNLYGFYKEGGHWITRIVDEVIATCSGGSGIVRVKTREGWIEWLENNGHDLTGVKVLTAGGSNSAERFFSREVLPTVKGEPVKVILFSGSGRESKATKDINDFCSDVKKSCRLMDRNVQSFLGGFVDLKDKISYDERFVIVGVVPQITSRYADEYDLGKLIDISKI